MVNRSGTDTDKELVRAIKGADEFAFEKLFLKYYGELKGFLRNKFGLSDEISRDLVQETFYRVWEKRVSLNPNKSIKAYLYQVARRLAIDHHRKKGNDVATLPDDYETAENSETADLINELQSEIGQLPPPLRQVVLLKWIEGYKYKEIAKQLNISPRTVEDRMAKALRTLSEKLRPFLMLILAANRDFFF